MIDLMNSESRVRLKLAIIGYQFPRQRTDNWCLLDVEVTQGDRVFHAVDASLETFDLVGIHEWFLRLSERRLPRWAELTFTEPCLSFQFVSCSDDAVRIGIQLSHEIRPKFALEQSGLRSRRWNVVCELRDEQFEGILEGVAAAIERFPTRRPRCGSGP
jgi:hypothetical protein